MKIEYTASTYTVAIPTPMFLRPSNSSLVSICHVWTREREKYNISVHEGMIMLTHHAKVDPGKLPCLVNWRRDFTMETILIELRRYMALPQHKKLPQPQEGSTF